MIEVGNSGFKSMNIFLYYFLMDLSNKTLGLNKKLFGINNYCATRVNVTPVFCCLFLNGYFN